MPVPPPEKTAPRPASKLIRIAWISDYRISCAFAYDRDLVAAMQRQTKRRFDPISKVWSIPATPSAYDELLATLAEMPSAPEVVIEADLEAKIEALRHAEDAAYRASSAAEGTLAVPTKLPLLPFQRAGVEYIDAHRGRAIVADEMGLGKTAQALGWLALRGTVPALVVAPATVRINWYREIERFTGFRPVILAAKSSVKSLSALGLRVTYDLAEALSYDIAITGYDQLRVGADERPTIAGVPIPADRGIRSLILDEAHYIKESKSQRTKAALALSRVVPHVMCLTGTPLLNRPREVWTLTQAVDQAIFPKFFPFAKDFCAAYKNRFGWDFSGASNTERLAEILRQRCMVRREKMTVLSELPDRRRSTIPLALNGAMDEVRGEVDEATSNLASLRTRREAWKATLAAMDEKTRKAFLADHAEEAAANAKITGYIIQEITRLRKILGLAKLDKVGEYVSDIAESGKVIVFAHHHEVLDGIVARLAEAEIICVKIDGRDDAASRQIALDRFANDESVRVAVLGIGAGGVGLNMQSASQVVFAELPWRPGDVDQAEARAWRMGQKNAVSTWFLVAMGTIEETIARVIDAKREVVNAVVDESDRTVDEDGILDAILAGIK